MNIKINRLDYKNPTNNGLKALPQLTSLDQINDINEVESINIYGDKDQLEALKSKMPKSYNWRINPCSNGKAKGYFMWVQFNTFWTNKNTGDVNETATKRRINIIKKLNTVL